MEFLLEDFNALKERDIIVLVDTNPSKSSSLRKRLRPHGFAFILIGKDGQVKLRKPSPWNIREIVRVIDKMPIRQQEIARKKQAQN
jgi:predicted SPOUT superfamily RNA methylase MTH1